MQPFLPSLHQPLALIQRNREVGRITHSIHTCARACSHIFVTVKIITAATAGRVWIGFYLWHTWRSVFAQRQKVVYILQAFEAEVITAILKSLPLPVLINCHRVALQESDSSTANNTVIHWCIFLIWSFLLTALFGTMALMEIWWIPIQALNVPNVCE